MPSSRELTRAALRFETPTRLPRNLWTLPWATMHHPEAVQRLRKRFPDDIGGVPVSVYRPPSRLRGDAFAVGVFVDEWGCCFENRQAGIIGEVRRPILPDLDEWKTVIPPYEMLPEHWDDARDAVNRACAASDLFLLGGCCARPWERYQFLRGTENAMCDMMDGDERVLGLLARIHEFHLREYAFWADTDVDALFFMDDWGSQRQLLLPPRVWRELFKPLYRDYIQIAHAAGKCAFMHSDGHLLDILPDLVELDRKSVV